MLGSGLFQINGKNKQWTYQPFKLAPSLYNFMKPMYELYFLLFYASVAAMAGPRTLTPVPPTLAHKGGMQYQASSLNCARPKITRRICRSQCTRSFSDLILVKLGEDFSRKSTADLDAMWVIKISITCACLLQEFAKTGFQIILTSCAVCGSELVGLQTVLY